jgi:outer membrane protein assembly factor BamB
LVLAGRAVTALASPAVALLASVAVASAQAGPAPPPKGPDAARPAAGGRPESPAKPKAGSTDRADFPFYPLQSYWLAAIGLPTATAPATDGARIFAAFTNGVLGALDGRTGTVIVSRQLPTKLAPVVDGPRVLVVGDGALEAVNTTDLAGVWKTPLPAQPPFAPVVRAGWAFLALDNGALMALRTDDGAVVWSTPLGAPAALPVVEGNVIYAATAGGMVQAVSVKDGAVAWSTGLEGDATALAAVEGHVFAATKGRWLYALDGRGRVRWRYRLQGTAIGLTVDEDRVVAVCLDQSVRAFKIGSGAQAWRRELSFRPAGGPVIAGRSILVTGFAPTLRLIDRETGANQGLYAVPLPPEPGGLVLETLAAGPLVHIGAAVFDDMVVLVTQHGWIHAARRGFDPPATPLTAMPSTPLPAPAPPPGYVEPPPAPTPTPDPAAPPATLPAPPPSADTPSRTPPAPPVR